MTDMIRQSSGSRLAGCEDADGDEGYTDVGDLDQTRTCNLVNGITDIAEQTDPPDPQQVVGTERTYGAAGNTTSIPPLVPGTWSPGQAR